jgi:hypothetical protein
LWGIECQAQHSSAVDISGSGRFGKPGKRQALQGFSNKGQG